MKITTLLTLAVIAAHSPAQAQGVNDFKIGFTVKMGITCGHLLIKEGQGIKGSNALQRARIATYSHNLIKQTKGTQAGINAASNLLNSETPTQQIEFCKLFSKEGYKSLAKYVI
jgi:hypothetical protein